MKQNFSLFVCFILLLCRVNGQIKGGNMVAHGLRVSSNNRFLEDGVTGKPVFILATTAWNINALTNAEIDTLLQSIAHNGFNSIMFTLNFYPQADEANIYGEKAYVGPDKTDLNPAYFDYCDRIINQCTRYGIYPMIYTMWSGKSSGTMNNYTAEQLYSLGKKLGVHFKQYRNVILVAGGESSPPYIDTAKVSSIGRGLKDGCENNNLVSVHPCALHSGADFYAGYSWLDFYMTQGESNVKGANFDLTKDIIKDYALPSPKPTMVAEHRYESGTTEDPIIQRRSLYLSVFSGAFGYAYGHNALWQMTPHTAKFWMLKMWAPGVDNWKKALNTPAQQQLANLKTLLYALPYFTRIPDSGLLMSLHEDSIYSKVEVMSDRNKGDETATYIMAYLSMPQELSLKTDIIKAGKLNVYWFNTQTGKSKLIEKKWTNTGKYSLAATKGNSEGILIITDPSRHYRLP